MNKIVVVLDYSFQKITNIGYPHDELSKIYLSPSFVILYTGSAAIALNRSTLIYVFRVRSNSRRDQMSQVYSIKDTIFVISYIKKLEVYYFNNDN